MKNEFVTYKQSVALKELGFNEDCFAVYSEHDETRVYNQSDIREGLTIPAPLYQQAFRFLRHNTKYRFYIIPCSQNKKHLFEITLPSSIVYTTIDEHAYDTYEEAERDLLDKLIEIIKDNYCHYSGLASTSSYDK